jgi:HSP20 family protein
LERPLPESAGHPSGVTEKDLRVSVQNNQLVIEGERKAPEGFEKNAFTQLAYGKFYTALTLPSGLDVDHVNCRLHNGVLDIQVPISEASKPKQIQIQTGSEHKAISA